MAVTAARRAARDAGQQPPGGPLTRQALDNFRGTEVAAARRGQTRGLTAAAKDQPRPRAEGDGRAPRLGRRRDRGAALPRCAAPERGGGPALDRRRPERRRGRRRHPPPRDDERRRRSRSAARPVENDRHLGHQGRRVRIPDLAPRPAPRPPPSSPASRTRPARPPGTGGTTRSMVNVRGASNAPLFMIDWTTDPGMRRRVQVGLNKGEAHHRGLDHLSEHPPV